MKIRKHLVRLRVMASKEIQKKLSHRTEIIDLHTRLFLVVLKVGPISEGNLAMKEKKVRYLPL